MEGPTAEITRLVNQLTGRHMATFRQSSIIYYKNLVGYFSDNRQHVCVWVVDYEWKHMNRVRWDGGSWGAGES